MAMKRFLVVLGVLVLWCGAAEAQTATPTETPTVTPTNTPTLTPTRTPTTSPVVCGAVSAYPVVQAMQFTDRSCRPNVRAPSDGKCVFAVVNSELVLDCPGQALRKFTLTTWP